MFRALFKIQRHDLSRIEREMRAHGFTDFSLRILYGRKENGIYKPDGSINTSGAVFRTRRWSDAETQRGKQFV